jgi:uncharacterized protein
MTSDHETAATEHGRTGAVPAVFGEPLLTLDAPFSYRCRGCSRCCREFRIQVNPYEIFRLARHLHLSTTEFIAHHLENGPWLRHKDDGTCVYLGAQGCTVHAARPLVCRLYPLGRHIDPNRVERFAHIRPHPETEGIYGTRGTVADYLQTQDALPFIEAADRYLMLFHRLYATLQSGVDADADATAATLHAHTGTTNAPPPDLLDPDRVIREHYPDLDPESLDPESALNRHIAALESWLDNNSRGEMS